MTRTQDLLCAVAIGVAGGWLISTAPGWMHASSYEHWWDIATAVGTIGAVFAAVGVPLYQNWDRRREQRRHQLSIEWALAEETYRVGYRLCEIGQLLKDSHEAVSATEISHLQSQLSAAKLATTDRVGRILIESLLYQAVRLHDEAVCRQSAGTSYVAAQLGLDPKLDAETKRSIEQLPALREQSFHWLERVIGQLGEAGMSSPAIVRLSGEVTMTMRATAEGSVSRSGEKFTAPPN